MATATSHSTSDEHVREATFEDCQAVLDLDTDVYYGLDYLRDHYHVVLNNPKIKSYVYEKEGKVVSFVCARLVDGGQTLFTAAGRVATFTRNEGVYGRFKKRVFEEWRGCQALRHAAMTVNNYNLEPKRERLLREYTIVMEKDITAIDVHLQHIRSLKLSAPVSPSQPFHVMTYDDVKCMMSHHPSQLRHLFPEERVLLQWCPLRIMDENTEEIFNKRNTVLARATSPIVKQEAGQCFPVTLMSTGGHYTCKLGRSYDVDMFGEGSDAELRAHLEWHLLRFAEAGPEEKGVIRVYFTRRVDHIVDQLHKVFAVQRSDSPFKKVFVLEVDFRK